LTWKTFQHLLSLTIKEKTFSKNGWVRQLTSEYGTSLHGNWSLSVTVLKIQFECTTQTFHNTLNTNFCCSLMASSAVLRRLFHVSFCSSWTVCCAAAFDFAAPKCSLQNRKLIRSAFLCIGVSTYTVQKIDNNLPFSAIHEGR
jgi:hypothetical protein